MILTNIGMFLWVRLVIGELKYCYSDATLEQTATSLPKGLEAAYIPNDDSCRFEEIANIL